MPATEIFRLFTEGDELYAAMLASIAGAQHHVRLESYIFADDETGRQFADALAERAASGVDVRLHLDAAGSMFWVSRGLIRRLRRHGVTVRWFHRWDWRHPWRYNRRNHRKLLIVDHHDCYIGGYNIHRENSRRVYGEARWRDTHVGFRGGLSKVAIELFDDFWNGRKRRRPPPAAHEHSLLLSNFRHGARRYLNGSFASMLSHATQSICLTTPYFVPDRRTQRLLLDAARRGVDVRLLVPRKNDVRLVQWASRAAYGRLLEGGVNIYEYLPRVLHAKTIVADAGHATVGTSNVDYRSFFLNYELNLFTRDPLLCRQLQDSFMADLEHAEQVHCEQWRRRFPGDRVLELVGWMARRLL